MRYQAIVAREGRAAVARFPDCPGCQTQADADEDISSLAREALEGWLEAHLVQGQIPPLPSTRKHRVPAGARTAEISISPSLAVRIQLRRARHDAGLSQTALAKKVGVSQQQIAALESPDANLTLSTLLKVARALGHEVEIAISTSVDRKGRKLQSA